MREGPNFSTIAALLGDPARANMVTALMDGRALAAGELADAAGVTLPTASGHLGKLGGAGLLVAEKQGRHRYYRLAGPEVAELLESLMTLAQRTGAKLVRTGPREAALREARVCYDHLAGRAGVAMLEAMSSRRLFALQQDGLVLTQAGNDFVRRFGIELGEIDRSRRPLCRTCLDWSERRDHLAGALGAALLRRLYELRWAKRIEGTRVVAFSPRGRTSFAEAFGPFASGSAE